MKIYLKALATFAISLALGMSGVEAATATKQINSAACEVVYTNYYFFLEASTATSLSQIKLTDIHHSTMAEYHNNSYQISNFDASNIGYGQVSVSKATTTSSDGITSMSLDEYYTHYLNAGKLNGAYSSGANNYIVSHDWYKVNSDGTLIQGAKGLNLYNHTKTSLMGATIDANSSFTRNSEVNPANPNPFKIGINRSYYGYLTGSPVAVDGTDWYLQPAVYYIQYCSTKKVEEKYSIIYDGNGSNVTNVPETQTANKSECTKISSVTPIREGYKFLGWSTNATSTVGEAKYAAGSEYCGENGDIILHAIWQKVETPVVTTYAIKYIANTTDVVTNMPVDISVNSDNDAYIASEVPVRSGYTFLGWSTDASSTVADPSYNGGTLYTARRDLVLYAVWQKNAIVTPLPENPQTGITDYLIPFGGVIGASGLGLGILKKKKTFKQF